MSSMTTMPRTEPSHASHPTVSRWVERWLSNRLKVGRLTIVWPGGAVCRIDSGQTGPDATVRLLKWRGVRRLVTGGALGFAEAFIEGDWDSPDLPTAVELAACNMMLRRPGRGAWVPRKVGDLLAHRRNENTVDGSHRNIVAHYDLGNAFYGLWLDRTMSYSSAYFSEPGETLETAQLTKCRRLLDGVGVRQGDHLLEIGCGWGNLSRLAARERGVSATAITVSPAQRDFAAAAVQRDGLGDRVTVELRDYREVTGQFDHIVSVEMIEAVGEKYWPVFFGRLNELLVPGGRAGLQAITIHDRLFDRYRRSVDFIQRHIFPGGLLPSQSALREHAADAGLTWASEDSFGPHYARTLAEWRDRFKAAWPKICELGFDERFRRLWLLYLGYCEGGFRAGNIDVRQIVLARPA